MKKPNILIFFTDDQRYNTIHALGNEEIHTPNLDKFVEESISFTNAHIMGGTCGAVCMPSRAMLQTGRNLFSLHGQGKVNGSVIPEEHITMPEYLKENGYYTHHIGKWHQDNKAFIRSYDNATRIFGFGKEWCGTMGGHFNPVLFDWDPKGEFVDEKAYHLGENGEKVPAKYGVGKVHSTDVFCDAAVDFINDYDDDSKPFYLYLATVAPHDPRQAPEEFEEMYNTENVSTPKNFMPVHPFDNGELHVRDEKLEGFPRRQHAIRRHISDYYAIISHLDSRFGDVINTLKKKGIYDNTIIIFAGDNGLALGQHGLLGKQSLYEHSIRVPLLVKPVFDFEPRKTDAFCYLFDIFPTVCDMCKLDIPNSVNGTSFNRILTNEITDIRDNMFGAYRNFMRMYKDHKYKIIEYHVNGKLTTQLFDIENDKWELHNLAEDGEYLDILNKMREKLYENQKKYNDPLVTQDKDILELENVW